VFLHKILVAALVVAPMALAPTDAAAQQRGPDRAQVAGGEASAMAAPSGLQPAFEGRTPPAVLQRVFPGLFPQAAPEPAPELEPEPEEECDTGLGMVNGELVIVDCHGNVVGDSELE